MRKGSRAVTPFALLSLLAACGGEQAGEMQMAGTTADVVMVIPATTASAEAMQYFMAGQRLMDVGRFVDANPEFKKAVEVDPDFARAYLNAANTANSLDEFRTSLELAAEYAEGASEAEKLLIEIAQKGFDNDVEGQLQLANQLVELEPTSPRAWLALAGIQAALSNHEEERASAMKAADLSPGFAPAYVQLGNSYLFNEPRDFSRAEEYMQKVVDLEPEEPLPYDFLGDVYRAQNELEKARDAYTRSADLDPANGLPLQQRGHVNSFLGDYDEARADYDAAIALGRANEKAVFAPYRAFVSVHAGYPQAAIEELSGLVEAIDDMGIPDPSGLKIFALNQQAVIALHHGLFTEAEQALELRSALMMEQAERVGTDEFRRGQEASIAYFEGVLAARRGDYETASAKAQEFMSLMAPDNNPRKNEPAHDLLGLISLLQGNHAQAVAHFEQADPNNVYTTYHLAVAHEGAGNSEEAKKLFRELAVYNFNAVGFALVRKDVIEKAQ